MSDNKRKFLLQSPDGKRALKIDEEGIHPMEAAEPGDENAVTVESRRIAGPLSEIISETPSVGPALVNSTEYRAGWERIFGTKREVGQA